MSRLTQRGATGPFSLFVNDTDAANVTYTGQKFDTSDGREVTLVNVGASNIASGLLVQAQPIVAAHQECAVTAYSAESVQFGTPAKITLTLGATAATLNEYAQGYAVVTEGTGAGQTLKVQSNPAAALSSSIVISLEDNATVALDNTSKVNLIPNPHALVVVNPTTATASPIGVTLAPATAGAYTFIVNKGVTACLNAGGTAVGLGLAASGSVAGAVATVAATTNQIASAYQAGTDTKYSLIKVNL